MRTVSPKRVGGARVASRGTAVMATLLISLSVLGHASAGAEASECEGKILGLERRATCTLVSAGGPAVVEALTASGQVKWTCVHLDGCVGPVDALAPDGTFVEVDLLSPRGGVIAWCQTPWGMPTCRGEGDASSTEGATLTCAAHVADPPVTAATATVTSFRCSTLGT